MQPKNKCSQSEVQTHLSRRSFICLATVRPLSQLYHISAEEHNRLMSLEKESYPASLYSHPFFLLIVKNLIEITTYENRDAWHLTKISNKLLSLVFLILFYPPINPHKTPFMVFITNITTYMMLRKKINVKFTFSLQNILSQSALPWLKLQKYLQNQSCTSKLPHHVSLTSSSKEIWCLG